MGNAFGAYGQFMNDPTAQVAAQFGQTAFKHGQEYVEQNVRALFHSVSRHLELVLLCSTYFLLTLFAFLAWPLCQCVRAQVLLQRLQFLRHQQALHRSLSLET